MYRALHTILYRARSRRVRLAVACVLYGYGRITGRC